MIILFLFLLYLGGAEWQRLPLLQPVAQDEFKYISSPFGWRTHPMSGRRKLHKGIDIVTHSKEARVFATAKGVVKKASYSPSFGWYVKVRHHFGIETTYAHLREVLVLEGEDLWAGQAIGIIGSTGRSTGVHLHYEIRLENVPIDPIALINYSQKIR